MHLLLSCSYSPGAFIHFSLNTFHLPLLIFLVWVHRYFPWSCRRSFPSQYFSKENTAAQVPFEGWFLKLWFFDQFGDLFNGRFSYFTDNFFSAAPGSDWLKIRKKNVELTRAISVIFPALKLATFCPTIFLEPNEILMGASKLLYLSF